jgi:hypothetical protein
MPSADPSSAPFRDLYICATNNAIHTIDPTQISLLDLLRLFPNTQTLYLEWGLQIAGTPMQLLPQVMMYSSPQMPTAMFLNLTELALDFSDLEYAEGFGATEMTMLFRYLRLYNVRTLRLRFQVTDEDDLMSDGWEVMKNALESMHFPQLKTVAIEIGIPADRWAEFEAIVSSIALFSCAKIDASCRRRSWISSSKQSRNHVLSTISR